MTLVVFAEPERPPARDMPWGTIASLCAHALVVALIPLLAASRTIPPPTPPQAVEVELVSPAELLPAVPAPEAPVLAAPQAETEPAEAAPVPQSGTIEATQFFAGKVLAEDKQIAAALPTLGNDERVIQLCNIEALEQIKAAKPDFAPDTLVAYAFGDMNVAAGVLTAPGGAFRSRRRWWAIGLRCAVAPTYTAVTAFEFTLGDEIPEEEWDAHFLTAEDAEE
jgi:hypothetical protein